MSQTLGDIALENVHERVLTGREFALATWFVSVSKKMSGAVLCALDVVYGSNLAPPGFRRIVRRSGDAVNLSDSSPQAISLWASFSATVGTPITQVRIASTAQQDPNEAGNESGQWKRIARDVTGKNVFLECYSAGTSTVGPGAISALMFVAANEGIPEGESQCSACARVNPFLHTMACSLCDQGMVLSKQFVCTILTYDLCRSTLGGAPYIPRYQFQACVHSRQFRSKRFAGRWGSGLRFGCWRRSHCSLLVTHTRRWHRSRREV